MQCDAMDFEAMHKWALKQFLRVVPHGKHMATHLARHHLDQLLFTRAPKLPAAEGEEAEVGEEGEEDTTDLILKCHCGERPCPHPMHVHCQMPGLKPETKHGRLHPLGRGGKRSVKVLPVSTMGHHFRMALRGLLQRMTSAPDRHIQQLALPEMVYQAQTMTLTWHNKEGEMEIKEILHASNNYYQQGPWYDAVTARHEHIRRGVKNIWGIL